MKKVLFVIAASLISMAGMAQDFEGEIVYSIAYSDLPAELKGQEQMLPKEQKVFVKGKKSRFEQETGMSSTIVISDSDANTSVVLMDAMGQRFKITLTQEDIESSIAQQGNPQVNYVSGTKEIMGYTCKKAEVTMAGMTEPSIFYYTEEIPPIELKGMESLNLKGMPLEYEMTNQGISMTVTVTKMDRMTLNDSIFEIPTGYNEMDDSMKAMMGIK